ncbi:MAG: hypothetical protein C4542_08125 [Dehalococcoidia bacterium]|nr:MAG: hypothetical protein C4542_08125 [Dehalococcoidia bacterium]
MTDIQKKYHLTLKDGLYYKVDGSAFPKKAAPNLVRGKLTGDGYKVTVVPVQPEGFALRILDMNENASTASAPIEREDTMRQAIVQEQPEAGTTQNESIEELRNKLARLEAEQKQGNNGGTDAPSGAAKGSAPRKRPERTPFSFNKLKFPQRPGYMRRVFNDVDGGMRIAQAKAAGWEVVEDPYAVVDSDKNVNAPSQMGKGVTRHVGTNDSHGSITGVLMEIPQEWYDEDQAKKNEVVDKSEAGLRRVNKDGVVGGLTVGDQTPEKKWRD